MSFPPLQNHVAGREQIAGGPRLPVTSPIDGVELTDVGLSTAGDVDVAVDAAAAALPEWSTRTVVERANVLHRYRNLLEANVDELAELVHLENGKTRSESRAEIAKAVELTELACSLPYWIAGESLEVSRGFDCSIQRFPIGVVASITPFNFPSMVPHWTAPLAIAAGNTMILKPSELVPISATRMAELFAEAGLPAGVFNVVHGEAAAAERLCDHPLVAAVTFVGSTAIAQQVYRRATGNLKRALAMGGAKNHLVVLPDADPDATTASIVASTCGCAGQRCMASANLIAVGDVQNIIDQVRVASESLTLGSQLGPVISLAAKQRIETLITDAERAGARVLVDGRGAEVQGCENGSYVGATVLDEVTPEMTISQEEIFGPVLSVIRAKNLEEALAIQQRSPYGNAAVIYTDDGPAAKAFVESAAAGMIGINVGVPVPREPFGFGGWKHSRFGVGDITGKASIHFWTQAKKVTTKWSDH